ncbi:MAG TPA: hypothetical protein VHW01_08865 [Polyangiaceae bacterium]|jgi:hypothetical protein|nr:hypothetical protein [Polyangiaceae bacterium]
MSGELPQLAPVQCSGRSASARGFGLFLALLVVLLQPRAFAASTVQLGASVTRVVAAHSQRVETDALRASAAVRVAPPQTFFRAPCLPTDWLPRLSPRARVAVARVRASQVRQAVSHFHSKRRIPRMNSDEPPRA